MLGRNKVCNVGYVDENGEWFRFDFEYEKLVRVVHYDHVAYHFYNKKGEIFYNVVRCDNEMVYLDNKLSLTEEDFSFFYGEYEDMNFYADEIADINSYRESKVMPPVSGFDHYSK